MRVLDLFAGIGGFSLGLERAGFETVAFCEIEPYAQKVLAKHWPEVPIYDDVRELTAERLASDGIRVDVITGGFPCQDISAAGKQAGIDGERSGLWSEVARLIGELRPRYAIMENVTALISGDNGRWFGRVLGDLAEVGYDCEWHCIPASELGAHHHRDRVWIIAYPCDPCGWRGEVRQQEGDGEFSVHGASRDAPNPKGLQRNGRELYGEHDKQQTGRQQLRGSGCKGYVSDPNSAGLQGRSIFRGIAGSRAGWEQFIARQVCPVWEVGQVEPTVCGGSDGFPNHAHRLKCLGNAVVPQIPELIGRAILAAESMDRAEDELVNLVTGIN